MIFGMFIALVATMLLPIVFMFALAQSSEKRPLTLRETLSLVAQPMRRLVTRVENIVR